MDDKLVRQDELTRAQSKDDCVGDERRRIGKEGTHHGTQTTHDEATGDQLDPPSCQNLHGRQ